MSKLKGTKTLILMICLMLSITLFLINLTTTIRIDNESKQKVSQIPKSEKKNELKSKPKDNNINMAQLSGSSFEKNTEQSTSILNQQNSSIQTAISRGTVNRNKSNVNGTEKSKTTTKLSDSTEVSPNTIPQAAQSTQSQTASQYENDLNLLARLITAEAQGEPYDAKVAVGAVVINRIESGLWANTIHDVIYQKINGYYQFTPVVNGWINKPAEPESIEAAKASMRGVDPTNGAQFYYDDNCTNEWILSKPISIQIGHMLYAY